MPKPPDNLCKACYGKGKNSKGGQCMPCRGTGRKQPKWDGLLTNEQVQRPDATAQSQTPADPSQA